MTDPYLIPGTDTLRNLSGYADPDELRQFEYEATYGRLTLLADRPIPGTYDLAHLRAFHRFIFQDVYDWAGELRTVNIAKGGTLFAVADAIVPYANDLFARLAAENLLVGLNHSAFVARAAHYLAEINALHPFREGNGRTKRAFLHQLAENAGWNIDWDTITADQNINASIAAMNGDETGFAELLFLVTTPRLASTEHRAPLRPVPNPTSTATSRRRPPPDPSKRSRRR